MTELPEVFHFRFQMEELARKGQPAIVAMFRDEEDADTHLPVVVRMSDLHNIRSSYDSTVKALGESGLQLKEIDAEGAQEIFIDRLSEFLVAASTQAGSSSTLSPTIVNSNRGGDTVLYAKGYFLSTSTGFGVSTPAKGFLAPGRYSFGIMDSGTPKFDPIVWNCPHSSVTLNQP